MTQTLPVLVVTGGSRGIGAATCLLAAQRGYAVVVNYVGNVAAAEKVCHDIHAGGGVITAQCRDSCESLAGLEGDAGQSCGRSEGGMMGSRFSVLLFSVRADLERQRNPERRTENSKRSK